MVKTSTITKYTGLDKKENWKAIPAVKGDFSNKMQMCMLLQEGVSEFLKILYPNDAQICHGPKLKKQGDLPDPCAVDLLTWHRVG